MNHVCILKIENKTVPNKSISKYAYTVQREQASKRTTNTKKEPKCLAMAFSCVVYTIFHMNKKRADRLNVCSFISFRCVMRAHIVRFAIAFHFISFSSEFVVFFLSTVNWCQHLSAVFFYYFVFHCLYVAGFVIVYVSKTGSASVEPRQSDGKSLEIRMKWMEATNTCKNIKNGRS